MRRVRGFKQAQTSRYQMCVRHRYSLRLQVQGACLRLGHNSIDLIKQAFVTL